MRLCRRASGCGGRACHYERSSELLVFMGVTLWQSRSTRLRLTICRRSSPLPVETDVLMVIMAIVLVLSILGFGILFLRLHTFA